MGEGEMLDGSLDESDGEVMGSIEWEDSPPRFILADISRDNAWLSIEVAGAAALERYQ